MRRDRVRIEKGMVIAVSKTTTPETEEVVTEEQIAEKPEQKKSGASVKGAKSNKKDDQQTKKLLEEIEKLKKKLDELNDLYQRMLAEYANYKRRTEQEKEQLSGFVKAETIKALLPALDNLGRAAEAPPGDEYKEGVVMTIRQLDELLKSLGLEAIDPTGQPFNPEIHHAVTREDAEGVEPDTVTEVYQKGYRLGGRILRPAMVKVAN